MSAIGPVRAAVNSKSDWATPWPLFNLLDREFRFTLDAAASEINHKCERYLSWLENALDADIFDETVFVNPPYGAGLARWIEAFGRWARNGCTVVALLPANTDTAWWHLLWLSCDEIRFLYRRVQFVGGGNSNTGGSAVVVWRPRVAGYDRIHYGPQVGLWDWKLSL